MGRAKCLAWQSVREQLENLSHNGMIYFKSKQQLLQEMLYFRSTTVIYLMALRLFIFQ